MLSNNFTLVREIYFKIFTAEMLPSVPCAVFGVTGDKKLTQILQNAANHAIQRAKLTKSQFGEINAQSTREQLDCMNECMNTAFDVFVVNQLRKELKAKKG